MKILVLGTRGIPHILGGVETHCEQLYTRMALIDGVDVEIVCRSCYVDGVNRKDYKGVKVTNIYAPKTKSLEAIVHSFLGVLYAGIRRPDILHLHAVGPCLVTPFAKLLGLKVVITHHGPDYERVKWGKLARLCLKEGERLGVKYANKVIVISDQIRHSIESKFRRKDAFVIPNGVPNPQICEDTDLFDRLKIQKYAYIFALGRFVPEKGFHCLIDAFKQSKYFGIYKLVIAGDADHDSEYSVSLKRQADGINVIFPGFLKGNDLNQLFSYARLFVIPSFYEGLPIALLEAMSYKLPIIASDIPANSQVKLPDGCYYPVDRVDMLKNKIEEVLIEDSRDCVEYDMSEYDWDTIVNKTINVYRSCLI